MIDKNNFTIRNATKKDVPIILGFIRELAEYEKALHEAKATKKQLENTLFGKKKYAECVIGYDGKKPVGFALFFHNYSTWLGKPGLYLEDLYVTPDCRGKGYGKALLMHLAKIAKKRGCGRFEWACLDWNTPSIEFYKKLGAKPMTEWTVYRVTGDNLKKLANV
ncbi:MAG: GNAT family N-acetyltransferase [archaeon]